MFNSARLLNPVQSPIILGRDFCNIFGDDINGAERVLGGLGDASTVDRQWYCPIRSIGRYRMECEHGHKGQVMKLCRKHVREFTGGKVTYCPACNATPPGHKCALSLNGIS